MFKVYRADLHLHTCLSPCADDEMRPTAIVKKAKKKGLDVIGICDHNSIGNVAAVRRAGKREGMAVIGGLEICSREEVHMLGLFDEEESLRNMQQVINENLQGKNEPDYFGQQHLCNEQDVIVGEEDKMLIGATELSVEEIVDSIHRFGGLAIGSHVDRECFSLLSQLGVVPEGLQVDALEISSNLSVPQARDCLPQISNYPLVSFSDSHQLEWIGGVFTAFKGSSASVAELRKALIGEGGREVIN